MTQSETSGCQQLISDFLSHPCTCPDTHRVTTCPHELERLIEKARSQLKAEFRIQIEKVLLYDDKFIREKLKELKESER